MAALSKSIRTKVLGSPANGYHDHPAGVDVFYEGALIAVDASGFAVPVSGATNNGRFLGVCAKEVDNSAGSAGDKTVRVTRGITYVVMDMSGAAQADAGDSIYSATDNPADSTKTSTGATLLGTIVTLEAAGKHQVRLQPDL